MAIAWLLAQPAVPIEAITVVHGLAHVNPGARNLRRLMKLAGREDIPVYGGCANPLSGGLAFPDEWRKLTDNLGELLLPDVADSPAPAMNAVDFLHQRFLKSDTPVRVLALGPLTNLALAVRGISTPGISQIVTMGGAVEVPGNLMDGYPGENEFAEWNIYCDPEAAAEVFALKVPQLLIGLDATNRVPVDAAFAEDFTSRKLTPLGQVVGGVIRETLAYIMSGLYYAWDPLAAMALLDPGIVTAKAARIEVIGARPEAGRTKLVRWDESSDFRVAVDADRERFQSAFLRPLSL